MQRYWRLDPDVLRAASWLASELVGLLDFRWGEGAPVSIVALQ